jgi:adenine-specific DNA-methyltransferase
VIKYLGSKRRLVPHLVAIVSAIPGARTVLDLFTGTTRVAQGLKAAGFHVTANDLASYSGVLAEAFVATDARGVPRARLERFAAALDALPGERGYVTATFCEEARYFQPMNGMRIDAIRRAIDGLDLAASERAILLAALLLAADKVDSTTGLQMAPAPRAAGRAGARAARGRARLRGAAGGVRRGVPRPAVQPALVPLQLSCVGDARAGRRAAGVRHRAQARGLPDDEERIQPARRGVERAP